MRCKVYNVYIFTILKLYNFHIAYVEMQIVYQIDLSTPLLQFAYIFYTSNLLCRIQINLYESLQIFNSYILVRLFVRFSSTYVDVMFPRILSFAKSQRLRICTRSNSISPSGQEEATLIIAVISQTGIYGQWIPYQDDLRK